MNKIFIRCFNGNGFSLQWKLWEMPIRMLRVFLRSLPEPHPPEGELESCFKFHPIDHCPSADLRFKATLRQVREELHYLRRPDNLQGLSVFLHWLLLLKRKRRELNANLFKSIDTHKFPTYSERRLACLLRLHRGLQHQFKPTMCELQLFSKKLLGLQSSTDY